VETDCLFHRTNIPVLQNQLYSTVEEAQFVARGEICLGLNPSGIVENFAFQPEALIYGPGYDNSQQSSAAFRQHLDAVARLCAVRYSERRIYEIGAGDGSFLDRLVDFGIAARGCDPAATGDHTKVDVGNYQSCAQLDAEVLILRHVVEHIANPVALLNDLAAHFPSANEIFIEVPNVDWIIYEHAWFDITYEHVNYFSPVVLRSLFEGEVDCHLLFKGQFVGVFADLRSLRSTAMVDKDECSRIGVGIAALQSVQEQSVGTLRSYCSASGLPVAIWGMAGKGATLLEVLESSGIPVSKVIDMNPKKWFKYTTRGQQVVPGALMMGEEQHLIIVSNIAYLAEVKEVAGHDHTYATVGRGGIKIL
jgi:hypothetical protein